MSTKDKRDPRVPVDRGWAWMVLAGSFALSTINVGTEKSYGIFFIEFLRKFNGTVSMTAMINAVLDIIFCICSVLVLNVGVKKFSVRVCVFIGITVCTTGYAISSFATGLEFLIVSQSIIVGAGIALYNIPIYILLGEYFDKRKGFANAVYISGNSLGGVIMPPLYRYVFDEYGLNGGLLITAGITFNSLVAATLLRPPGFYTKNKSRSSLACSFIKEDEHVCDEDKIPQPNKVHDNGHCEILTNNSETSVRLLPEIICDHNEMNNDTSHDGTLERIFHSNLVRHLSNRDLTSAMIQNSGLDRSQSLSADKSNKRNYLSSCKTIMDCSVMTDILYVLFLGIYCLGNAAVMSAHIYTPAYAKDIGIDDSRIVVLVSIASITDFFGRIFCGFLVDRTRITPQRIIMFSQIVVGVLVQFMSFYTTFWHLVVFVVIYGSTAGSIVALFPPLLINIVGKENYANAMAIFIVFVSVFGAAVLPTLGYFRDVTNKYHVTFHVMGACSFVCVLLLIVFEVISTRRSRSKDSGKIDNCTCGS